MFFGESVVDEVVRGAGINENPGRYTAGKCQETAWSPRLRFQAASSRCGWAGTQMSRCTHAKAFCEAQAHCPAELVHGCTYRVGLHDNAERDVVLREKHVSGTTIVTGVVGWWHRLSALPSKHAVASLRDGIAKTRSVCHFCACAFALWAVDCRIRGSVPKCLSRNDGVFHIRRLFQV